MATRINLPAPPSSIEDLVVYLGEYLPNIQDALSEIADGLYEINHVAPLKPKVGLVMYADGTNWNPDGVSGEGLYVYKSDNLWHFLG